MRWNWITILPLFIFLAAVRLFGFQLDSAEQPAAYRIDGTPASYTAGRSYSMNVVHTHPDRMRQSAQISVRYALTGGQAGRLVASDPQTKSIEIDGIQYLIRPIADRTIGEPLEIHFEWIAPDPSGGPVHFIAAANSDSSSADEGSNHILTAATFTTPSQEITEIADVIEIYPTEVKAGTRLQETSRIANLPSPMDLDRGSFEMQIQHRFFQTIEGSGPGTAFGIDFGANINLGMNYAFTDRLSAGVARTRVDQIIAFTGTYEIQTDTESFWNLSVHGGIEGQDNFQNHYSPFVQAASSFDYKMIRIYAVPTVVFNSREDAFLRPGAINPESNHTFSLGLGTDIAIHRRISINGEYVPRLAGFGGFDRRRPHLSGGIAIRTWGHVFSVMVSTSRDFTPAKYAINAERRDYSLGFNIYRKIR